MMSKFFVGAPLVTDQQPNDDQVVNSQVASPKDLSYIDD